ncbi:MAG: lysostaphin resistance A-like protein [Propionibacteriaceae bacterium]|nr:lysostaphin resistance A-like protein [Propionibacteriaceae bacterium]
MPARRWWWALIALVAYGVAFVVVMVIVVLVWVRLDQNAFEDPDTTSPSDFLGNNLYNATDIALCTLIAFVFFRQGFGWLCSVVGRMRWRWLLLALGIAMVGYGVVALGEIAFLGVEHFGADDMEWKPYTWFVIATIVLTTPLQCAGEEFQARALLPKLIAAIVPIRHLGLLLSAILPAILFTVMHNAQDFWLNLDYVCFALMAWWLAYRTGGIEASIALHLANNLWALWMIPFQDFSDLFDRSDGTGSPFGLAYIGLDLGLVLLIDYVGRRRGIVRLSAPAAGQPVVVKPRAFWSDVTIDPPVVASQEDLPRINTTVRLWVPDPALVPNTAVPVFPAATFPYNNETITKGPAS